MGTVRVGEENSTSIDLHYEDRGAGQPVVLIHGFPLSGRSWEKQAFALLDAGFRVITYDRRGFGDSSQPSDGLRLRHVRRRPRPPDDVAGPARLDPRRVLDGHGEVTRYLATYGSSRVSRAVLIGVVPPFLLKDDDNPGRRAHAGRRRRDRGRHPRRPPRLPDGVLRRLLQPRRAARDAHQRRGGARQLERRRRRVARGHGRLPADVDHRLPRRPPRIDVPTLVVHGTADRILPIDATARRLPDLIADCTLVEVEGAPHGMLWTHADEVNEALLAFVADRAAV
jgi:pimeloyl-ACP methyl ester carboxylesterase